MTGYLRLSREEELQWAKPWSVKSSGKSCGMEESEAAGMDNALLDLSTCLISAPAHFPGLRQGPSRVSQRSSFR